MKEERPWGFYEVLLDADDCKVKRITVKKGQRISLQKHYKRAEVWTIVSGHGFVTIDDEQFPCGPQGRFFIPKEAIHRIEAHKKHDLVFIEVQLGDYFGEDDIERFQDDYARI